MAVALLTSMLTAGGVAYLLTPAQVNPPAAPPESTGGASAASGGGGSTLYMMPDWFPPKSIPERYSDYATNCTLDGVYGGEERAEVYVCEELHPSDVAGYGPPDAVLVDSEWTTPPVLLHELGHTIGWNHSEMDAGGGLTRECERNPYVYDVADSYTNVTIVTRDGCDYAVTPWGTWPEEIPE